MRTKTWTGLCHKSKALSIFDGTEGAKRDFDSLFVIPVDIRVNDLDELLDGCRLPVPRVEQLRFQPPEEALTGRLSGEHPLRDIERISFALCIRESHPGQR